MFLKLSSVDRNAPSGFASLKTTVVSSGAVIPGMSFDGSPPACHAWMPTIPSQRAEFGDWSGLALIFQLNRTSLEVNGVPSLHFTPLLSLTVHSVASALAVIESARRYETSPFSS